MRSPTWSFLVAHDVRSSLFRGCDALVLGVVMLLELRSIALLRRAGRSWPRASIRAAGSGARFENQQLLEAQEYNPALKWRKRRSGQPHARTRCPVRIRAAPGDGQDSSARGQPHQRCSSGAVAAAARRRCLLRRSTASGERARGAGDRQSLWPRHWRRCSSLSSLAQARDRRRAAVAQSSQ